MSWEYSQHSKTLKHNGHIITTGYSGRNEGLNNPDMEGSPNVGPIPRGRYTIGRSYHHETKGPVTMKLSLYGHNALGRSNFSIYGDNNRLNSTASEGCIILNREARELISASGDAMLDVVR